MLPQAQLMTEPPPPSAYVDQFMADLALLPSTEVAKLAEGLQEEGALPLDIIRAHVSANPNRVPQLFALVVRDMPYYRAFRHFEWVDKRRLYSRHGKQFFEVFGIPRTCMCWMAFYILEASERNVFLEVPRLPEGSNLSISPCPSDEEVAKLDLAISSEMVPVDSLGKGDLQAALQIAEKRAVRAEKELKDAQLKWAKTEKRILGDAERAKKNIAEKVQGEVGKTAQAQLDALKDQLKASEEALRVAKSRQEVAEARIQEIDASGGATPERVEIIRREIQGEADQRIEDELSMAVRPWLVRLTEMEKQRQAFTVAMTLSSKALTMAKQEAEASDVLIHWDRDRVRGLKVLEQEMTELDALMQRVIKPSAELSKLHGELLQAMLKCRKQLNPDKPLGEVAKALISGIKKVKDEDLGEAAYAVRKLAEKGVFLGLEAETLLKIVDGEMQARYDSTHFKQSVQGRMIQRLHAGDPVDILVDGYNYMFTAHQHFGDKLKLNRNAEGEAVFGEAGRAKFTKLLSPLVDKFPSLQVRIYFDGLVKENRHPHARITLIEPTYQRSGKGQADEEIAHVGLKNVRKGAIAVVVSNDKVVQRYADHFLSVRLFSDFIATA